MAGPKYPESPAPLQLLEDALQAYPLPRPPPLVRSGVEGKDDYVLLEVVGTGMGIPPIVAVTVCRLPSGDVPDIVDHKEIG